MRIHTLPLLLLALAACSDAPSDSGVDTSADTGEDTGSPNNVIWRPVHNASWNGPGEARCDTLVAAILSAPEEVGPWFAGMGYTEDIADEAPQLVIDDLDWESEAALVGAISCGNTQKVLTVSAVNEAAGTVTAGFHLLHPGLDGGLETVYWAAAAIPAALADNPLETILAEEQAPEPE
jgi:hypothetical protein